MFPKKGKVFPGGDGTGPHQIAYAAAIAEALRGTQGDTHQAIKTVMGWTGANERTVKNWFAGTNGPSGEHLVSLAFHSNSVLEAFLRLSGREGYAAAFKLIEARDNLIDMLKLLQMLIDKFTSQQDAQYLLPTERRTDERQR